MLKFHFSFTQNFMHSTWLVLQTDVLIYKIEDFPDKTDCFLTATHRILVHVYTDKFCVLSRAICN